MSDSVSTQLTITVPAGLMAKFRALAAADFRTPEEETLWVIQNAVNAAASAGNSRWNAPGSVRAERVRRNQEIVNELQRLYVQAGRPSCRNLAEAVSGKDFRVAHSTVNTAINGTIPPSLPLLERLVAVMHGDVEHFKALWAAANE